MSNAPLFTIITCTYRYLEYIQQSLKAIRGQTYKNLEIIVVNNGAPPEITDFLVKEKALDPRIKIVHFEENQFSEEDPWVLVKVAFNGGLKAATGDYVFFQCDDDVISHDFVEKMIKLFVENPACTSAAGLIKDIDEAGRVVYEGQREYPNYRPRYMPGHLMVLNVLCSRPYGAVMVNGPGIIFTLKREELIKAGGYHPSIEASQLYGIVPFGITGFDDTAVLYWRRHEGQSHLDITSKGHVALRNNLPLIRDWQLEQRWQVFGKEVARFVVRRIYEDSCRGATGIFAMDVYYCRFKACGRIFKQLWFRPFFWRKLLPELWDNKVYVKYALKPVVKRVFESHPWLVKKFPGLLPLQERAFK